MLQANAPADPGDSGGPMIDNAGQIVGVTTAGADTSAGTGQQNADGATGAAVPVVDATPINVARAWIAQVSASLPRADGP